MGPFLSNSTESIPLVAVLVGLSLLPFLLVLTTSFAKFAIVLSFLRRGLGTPQIPPAIVVTALAGLLTVLRDGSNGCCRVPAAPESAKEDRFDSLAEAYRWSAASVYGEAHPSS